MKIFFKVLSILFALLFIVSAGLQYNDPDPLLWIAIWSIAAILSLLFFSDKISSSVLFIVGAVCFIGFLNLFPSNFQGFGLDDGDIKDVELAREAVGLLIIALVLFMYAFRVRYLKMKSEKK